MTRPRIVAFSGLAGSGKNTAADMLAALVTHRGGKVQQLSFADPLKRICKDVFDFSLCSRVGNNEGLDELRACVTLLWDMGR